MTLRSIRLVMLCLAIPAMSGCGTSPRETYYTLSAGMTPEGATPASADSKLSITVGPVMLPEIVDRPQLVLRVNSNQVNLVELHRWAEPLKSVIPRVIADNLSSLLGAKQVYAFPSSAGDQAEYRVLVEIQRFESALGDSATIDALWTVRRVSDGAARAGRLVAREFAGGSSYDAVVAAHSRALVTVTRDIAEAIKTVAAIPQPSAPQPSAP